VSKADSHIPPAIDRAVDKAIEKSPPNRYESVPDFKKDLSAALKQIPGASDVTGATAIRAAAPESTTLRTFPAPDPSGSGGITPPSGALARSPAPSDATPSGMRRNVSLELMDFRDPNAAEEPVAAPAPAPAPPPLVERSAAQPSGSSQGKIFGIVLGLLVASAGAYWYFMMRPAANPSAPAPAPVASAPKPEDSPAVPPPAKPAAEAAKRPEIPPVPKPPETKAEKTPETKTARTEPARPAEPVVKKMSVSFSTTPSAVLYVDGEKIGDTVPRKTMKLDTGKHSLRFELEDGTTFEQAFEVGKDQPDSFFHQFPVGSILVTAGPEWKGAKVLVDSKMRGKIPLSGVLMASPGPHEVAIVGDGIPPVLKTIKVEANRREEVHIPSPDRNP